MKLAHLPQAIYPDRQRCLTHGKLAWSSRKKARQAGRHFGQYYGKAQREYRCPDCSEWHLTTKPNRSQSDTTHTEQGPVMNDHAPIYERTFVTPDIAAEYLTHNTHNRKADERTIADYTRDILAGNWLENGDSIRFDWNGVMLNGQHTCKAIVRANKGVWSLVVTNLDPATQDTMDGGRKRTAKDMFMLAGEANSATIASIVRLVFMWNNGDRRLASNAQATKAEQRAILNANPSIRRSAEIASRTRNAFRPAWPSTLGFAHQLFLPIDAEATAWFFEQLGSGVDLKDGDPVRALRSKLTNDAVGGVKRTNAQMMTYLISAWNARREGRTLARVVYTAGQNIPDPK